MTSNCDVARATTVRFTDEVYARLDQASAETGMPVNSIVVAACLDWMDRYRLASTEKSGASPPMVINMPRPRWATLRRAVKLAVTTPGSSMAYPFERFTSTAQKMLTAAQAEAHLAGSNYIGTEHLMLAAFVDPTSQAAKILASLQLKEDSLRSMVDEALRRKRQPGPERIIPTSRVKKVIELAFNLCGSMGSARVTTGHILLALSAEGQGVGGRVLNDSGATPDRIRALGALAEPEI